MAQEKLAFCLKATGDCLKKLRVKDQRAEVLLRFARDYFKDAEYYAAKPGRQARETALEAVAYAHGFIDAAVLLGLVEIPGYHLKAAVGEKNPVKKVKNPSCLL